MFVTFFQYVSNYDFAAFCVICFCFWTFCINVVPVPLQMLAYICSVSIWSNLGLRCCTSSDKTK